MTWTRGAGSLRQRRLDVWEVRVALGPDLVSGRSAVRSLTVHGDRLAAEDARAQWAAQAALVRSQRRVRPGISLAELLELWLDSEHRWRPSTLAGYRSTVGFLVRDPLASRRAVDLAPNVLRAACADTWRAAGWADPTIWARVRVLRSALGWAHAERVLDRHPLEGMRGQPQPGVRLHAPVEAVRALLEHARVQVNMLAAEPVSDRGTGLHRAEQVLLLARLAADSGARRGELAALQLDDLDGDVLTIARARPTRSSGRPRPAASAGSRSAPLPQPCGATLCGPGSTVWRGSRWGSGCSPLARTTRPG